MKALLHQTLSDEEIVLSRERRTSEKKKKWYATVYALGCSRCQRMGFSRDLLVTSVIEWYLREIRKMVVDVQHEVSEGI